MMRSLRSILFGPRIRVPEEVRSQLGPADMAASDDAEAKARRARQERRKQAMTDPQRLVQIDYTNWHGMRSIRTICPQVNDADYQACHDAMVRELENIAWRDAIAAALVVIEGNKPRVDRCSVCGAYGDCWQNCTYPGCPDGR